MSSEYLLPQPGSNLLLVAPPTYPRGRKPDYNPKPLGGPLSIAAQVNELGLEARVFDADVLGLSALQTASEIVRASPSVVGLSVLQRTLPATKLIHNDLRNQGYKGMIIYGGIGATLCYRDILTEMPDTNSAVFLGEAEETVPVFLNYLQTGDDWRQTPSIAYIDPNNPENIKVNNLLPPPDLATLPFPDRTNLEFYLDKAGYWTIDTSRGCPWSWCSFCSNSAFERHHGGEVWRNRPAVAVVRELVDLYQTYGVRRFKTNDPNLFGPIGQEGTRHVWELCQGFIEAKERGHLPPNLSLMSFIRGEDVASQPKLLAMMRRAGWDRLLVGIESSNNVTLDPHHFNKGETVEVITRALEDIRGAGMSVVAGFMIFHPYSTLESIQQDLQFLEAHGLEVTLAKSLRVFNGVPLQRVLESEDRLEPHSPFETYHEYHVPPQVASLYYVLKRLHSLVEDPLREYAQDRIWQLKAQGNTFNQRVDWGRYGHLTWQMESSLLHAALNYFNDSKDPVIIATATSAIYNYLGEQLDTLGLTWNDVRDKVIAPKEFRNIAIRDLISPPTDTLHEEYVWNQN